MERLEDIVEDGLVLCAEIILLCFIALKFSSFHSVELIEPFAWNKDVLDLPFGLLVFHGGKQRCLLAAEVISTP